jgi:hypothetical protein
VLIMSRLSLATAAVVSAAALAGCSASSGGAHHPPPVLGIRGTALPTFSCHVAAGSRAVQVRSAAVLEVRLCPLSAPAPFSRRAVTVTARSVGFTQLVSALSLPDVTRSPGMMCPEYAELLQPVIARTASTALLVHLPVDGCDHTLAAVSSALAAVRG